MGNGVGKFTVCFSGDVDHRRRHDLSIFLSKPLDEGLGHSFCYIRPECNRVSSSEETTTFRAISGASVSANTSTPLSTSMADFYSSNSIDRAAAFESSTSFASIPLQPIPRDLMGSGPIPAHFDWASGSGALERGFFSGPIERAFVSGPIDVGMFSGPIENSGSDALRRCRSRGDLALKLRSGKGSVISVLKRAFSKKTYRGHKSIVAPIKAMKEPGWIGNGGLRGEKHNGNLSVSSNIGTFDDDDDAILYSKNLQWAQGKAGEDRVHVVVSDEHGWVFVGIYDGFNGPDAPDFLVSNLYSHVHEELKGLLWDDDKFDVESTAIGIDPPIHVQSEKPNSETQFPIHTVQENCSCSSEESNTESNCRPKKGRKSRTRHRGSVKKIVEAHKWWKSEWERERMELDKRLKEQLNRSGSVSSGVKNHKAVLKALSEALRKTEKSYLEIADMMLSENPELALMGSCVLVMLMKGEDVYVMNVGDSRAVLAQREDPNNHWSAKIHNDLEKISEESSNDLESSDGEKSNTIPSLNLVELSEDHSTSVDEEVQRIKAEHPNDADALMNDRVKGSLKVTRAFGAGFLKQPKWNNALLEMFRIDYQGTAPYITCDPSLYHHSLCPEDRFLILSSDGLYQYFTNEQAVSEVQHFIELQPEGDPAQHLVEQVIYRAAKKAGMDFHELLDIPQGDRRRYHDDVSIIVISLEGRIWRSCV